MLYVLPNKTIRLTRGDTAYLTIPITTSIGEEYVMSTEDTIKFSIKKNLNDEQYLVHKTVVGSNELKIEPIDTKDLAFGKYKYDVELVTVSGDIFTLIDVSTFEILPEVTC